MEEKMFPENNRRVTRQKKSPIRVVIGNPPYSAQQDSESDNNKNLVYPATQTTASDPPTQQAQIPNCKKIYMIHISARMSGASDRIAGKGVGWDL